jgi:hypothetical protein
MNYENLSSSCFIRCVIYTDVLATGEKSPGYVPVYDTNGFPAAWVVPESAYNNRNMRGYLDRTIHRDGPLEAAKWADDNVRLVQVMFPGQVFAVDPKLYDVIVPAPFRTATFGFLDPKRGSQIQVAVPSGESLRNLERNALVNMGVSLSVRLKMARSHLQTVDGAYRGIEPEVRNLKFPRAGDNWT